MGAWYIWLKLQKMGLKEHQEQLTSGMGGGTGPGLADEAEGGKWRGCA